MARTPPTRHASGLRRAGTRPWRLPGSSAVQRDAAPPHRDPPGARAPTAGAAQAGRHGGRRHLRSVLGEELGVTGTQAAAAWWHRPSCPGFAPAGWPWAAAPGWGGRRLVGGSGQPLCPIPGSGRGEPGLGAEWVLQPPTLPTSISFMGWEQGQKGLGRAVEQALLPVQHKPSATVPGSTTRGALGGQERPAVTSGNTAAAGVGSRGPEASAGPTAPGLGSGLGDAEQGYGDAVGAGRQQEGGCSPWPPFGHRHQVGSCTLLSSSRSCSAAGLVLSPAAMGSPLPTSPGGCGVPDSGTRAVGAGGLPSPQAGVLSACSHGSRCRGAVDRSRRSEPRYQRPRAGNWILQIQSGALGREFSP